jgi:S1-C subfamily serine protease
MTRASATLLCVLCALALGACGRDSSSGDDASPAAGTSTGETRTVERSTRVEVVKESGEAEGFDPEGIYRREGAGVVTIISAGLPGETGQGAGQGSGFVINADGEIVTNAHVVTSGEGRAIRKAENVYVRFEDGNQVPARIVGFDPFSDVALLKIDPAGLTLRPLPLGSSNGVAVGAPVAAIGSPFGEEQSLSVGVVSALDRDIQSLTGFETTGAVQTDAAINRGNSGGPLLDARGRVLGINSQIKSSSGGGEGVGFAVPVDTVRRSLDSLRETGKVAYGFLGVSASPLYPQLARRLGLPVERGALVASVEKGSPAAKADLSAGKGKIEFQGQKDIPRGGDVIVAVDGRELTQDVDLPDLIGQKGPGQKIRLEVVRRHDRRTVTVTLAPRPSTPPPAG